LAQGLHQTWPCLAIQGFALLGSGGGQQQGRPDPGAFCRTQFQQLSFQGGVFLPQKPLLAKGFAQPLAKFVLEDLR
jgi:hypothetical protein